MIDNLSTFTQNDYEITQREVMYQGFFRLVRNHVKHLKFDNTWTREIHARDSGASIAVGVLPYDQCWIK